MYVPWYVSRSSFLCAVQVAAYQPGPVCVQINNIHSHVFLQAAVLGGRIYIAVSVGPSADMQMLALSEHSVRSGIMLLARITTRANGICPTRCAV